MKLSYLFLMFSFLLIGAIPGLSKERVIVLTDITNEPDDQQSLVRFLVYSNEYDIEGIVATTSLWLRDRISPENIQECIDAYGRVRDTLSIHAAGFPSADSLKSKVKKGLPVFGMNGVGEGKSSEGSRHLIEVVDRDDPRPVWISVWGGANCLAQALWEVRQTRTSEELKRFISKIRVYTISDQDDSGPWMRRNFPDLFYIVSPGAEQDTEYHNETWSGISGDAFYLNGPQYRFDLVSNEWLEENIRTGHGALGEMYPPWEYIMEGDTPSYLGLINNGLGSHVNPSYGGWGGRYVFKKTYAYPTAFWTNTRDVVTTPDGVRHVSGPASIWRWRVAYQHDFAARMDWCVADKFASANHNPIAVVNGDKTKNVLHLHLDGKMTVELSAEGSHDPDEDELSYRWFHYFEAEQDVMNKSMLWSVGLEGEKTQHLQVTIPDNLHRRVAKANIHIVLEVVDDGEPNLYSYRRIILHRD